MAKLALFFINTETKCDIIKIVKCLLERLLIYDANITLKIIKFIIALFSFIMNLAMYLLKFPNNISVKKNTFLINHQNSL